MKLWVIAFAFTIVPTFATAQTTPSDSLATASATRAQVDFEAGVKSYLAGEYESAIVSWEKAYRVWPAKIMQYNISKALGKLGRFSEAASYATKAGEKTKPDLTLPPSELLKNDANLSAWNIAI